MSNTQQKPEMQGVGGTTLLNQALLELICCLHHPNALSMGLLSEGSTSTSWAKLEGCSFKSFQRGHSRHKLKSIKEQSFSQQRSHTKLLSINATSGSQPLESDPEAYGAPNSASDLVKNAFDAFYRFSRPHTVVGTALSIVSVSLLSIDKLADISPLFFTGMLEAVAAALMMNIYIVGLNQLTDIDIDKVNKPYLPLASGEYSVGTGVLIVTSFSIMLPLLRWKRFAFVAALCILAVRAVIVQICFYLHMQMHVFGRSAIFSRPLIFATAFMSFFSVVIALFKDIPDMEGDKIFGIKSFTVQLGQKRVFWTCIALLEIAYGIAMLVGAASPFMWSKGITVIGHSILALLLWNRAKSVDLTSKAAIASCYMFVWKLFYAEYLLIPLVR
ncbi:unnamed protein product [Linum tenue]|uniref:Homogentisate phytyltransferase n=1 Tax=Linum tenue TaxID=586396 RepID=A0AAV0RNB7_9ROSI|nr:unnamed protein product [Linum tenue]